MIINTRKRTSRQNKAAYRNSIKGLQAKARKRLKKEASKPQIKKSFSLSDLSPELRDKLELEQNN